MYYPTKQMRVRSMAHFLGVPPPISARPNSIHLKGAPRMPRMCGSKKPARAISVGARQGKANKTRKRLEQKRTEHLTPHAFLDAQEFPHRLVLRLVLPSTSFAAPAAATTPATTTVTATPAAAATTTATTDDTAAPAAAAAANMATVQGGEAGAG